MMKIAFDCDDPSAEGNQAYSNDEHILLCILQFQKQLGHALILRFTAKASNVFMLLATQVSHQVAKPHPIKSAGSACKPPWKSA